MERIVVNVQTGETTVVPYTDEEIAEALALAEAEPAPQPPTLAELQAQLAAIQAQINQLAGVN